LFSLTEENSSKVGRGPHLLDLSEGI